MKRYGMPYMGSKNLIAEWVVSQLRVADNLYDMFAGGCAITHRAMMTKKYKHYHINDVDGGITQLFLDAIAGKFANETRWIDRETFFERMDVEPYIKCCWSFGSDGRTYMYGRDIEDYKKALHYAVVFGDYEPMLQGYGIDLSEIGRIKDVRRRRIAAGKVISISDKDKVRSECSLNHLENLERLQGLQELIALQQYCNGDAITRYNASYEDIEIKPNSMIYCDPPYYNTEGYNNMTFDHERFYEWCERQIEPIMISEYWMPEDRFVSIASRTKQCTLSATTNSKVIENLYVPRHQLGMHTRQLSLF